VCHIALFHLSHTEEGRVGSDGRQYYHWKKQLMNFVDINWDRFWNKPRPQNWSNSIASSVSTDRFVSGKEKFDESGK
jgi:hypothetical protein